jgi:hypothetical protein
MPSDPTVANRDRGLAFGLRCQIQIHAVARAAQGIRIATRREIQEALTGVALEMSDQFLERGAPRALPFGAEGTDRG